MLKSALDSWYRQYIGNIKFTPVDAKFVKGNPAVLFFEEGAVKPWSVQFCGNGHYYYTAKEAVKAFETLKYKNEEE